MGWLQGLKMIEQYIPTPVIKVLQITINKLLKDAISRLTTVVTSLYRLDISTSRSKLRFTNNITIIIAHVLRENFSCNLNLACEHMKNIV